MNAVAAGAPAYRDDKVARLRFLAAAVYRNQPHRPAEDERVAEITLVEADVIFLVEANHACIVFEDAYAPVVRAKPAANFLGCSEDCFLEEVVEMPAVEVDLAFECFVRAMLRPGLGHGLQLGIGWLALQLAEAGLD